MDSIGDLFDNLNVKASKVDIRRWKNKSEFGSYISLLEFVHAYAQIFYEEEDEELTSDNADNENRRDPMGWKEKGGQKSLAKAHCGAPDAFDRHSVSKPTQRRGRRAENGRMIPARRMRAAIWELDRDVSQNQMKNYISDCGLRVTDNLTLAEFARCYYYLFFDSERDGSVGGSYHKKLFETEGSSARYSDDTEP